MRRRINIRVNVQEYIDFTNAEKERRRIVFTDAIQNIIKEKNVRYNEAKLILTKKLSLDIYKRRMQMVS